MELHRYVQKGIIVVQQWMDKKSTHCTCNPDMYPKEQNRSRSKLKKYGTKAMA